MGRSQVLAVAILGAWIMLTLCMWFAATSSFSTVARVLKRAEPQFLETTRTLDEGARRLVLRYMASEINRALFWGYGAAQLVLGALLLLVLWRQTPRHPVDVGVVMAMLALAVVLTLGITPMLVSIGRSIDFVPRNPPPPIMPRFWALHGAFTGLDGVKLLAGIFLLVRWVLQA